MKTSSLHNSTYWPTTSIAIIATVLLLMINGGGSLLLRTSTAAERYMNSSSLVASPSTRVEDEVDDESEMKRRMLMGNRNSITPGVVAKPVSNCPRYRYCLDRSRPFYVRCSPSSREKLCHPSSS